MRRTSAAGSLLRPCLGSDHAHGLSCGWVDAPPLDRPPLAAEGPICGRAARAAPRRPKLSGGWGRARRVGGGTCFGAPFLQAWGFFLRLLDPFVWGSAQLGQAKGD
eukprot:357645-Chlamydomonas_euryale.AAC.5